MTQPAETSPAEQLRALAGARNRIAIILTVLMIVIYFGFIILIAFDKGLLARIVVPGLSLGILLGALVIVASWLLTWFYVRWANTHYDTALTAMGRSDARGRGGRGGPGGPQ
jgi:uncharacterized membrane protein (DUF485 family)